MKKILISSLLLILFFGSGLATSFAQGTLIRKMKDKVEQKVVDEIFKDSDKNKDQQPPPPTQGEVSSTTQNRKGGGLSQTAPDVNQNIADAGTAFDAKKYSESKAALKQALWGVELEIGQKILKSLPEKVEGLAFDKEQDKVTSSGAGFMGLIISRAYQGKAEKELHLSIGNDAALLGMARIYMQGGAYGVNSSDNTNQKTIRFKDHQAFVTYDDDEGYKLTVSFGQSSIFALTGKNFETEKEFMASANNFDIGKIKQELGEQ